MSDKLKKLDEELIQLKRMINGFIATNPDLADLELEGISFRYKEPDFREETFVKSADKTTIDISDIGFAAVARCCVRPDGSRHFPSGAIICPPDHQPCG